MFMVSHFRKTKIICTVGPVSESEEKIQKLVDNGMDVARLNFSHGSHEEHLAKIHKIRKVSKDVGILLDTKGPEVRTGSLLHNVTLYDDQKLILTTQDVIGDENRIAVSYTTLHKEIKPGQSVFIDDGFIELVVDKVEGQDVHCTVVNGGLIDGKKTMSFPGMKVNLESVTEKDMEDIKFAIDQDLDFIALSFINNRDTVLKVKKMIEKAGKNIAIISKIETQEACDNFDGILEASDGIMVARGDLGIEIAYDVLPLVQKEMVKKCNQVGKPVIVATQMLNSMIENPRATRAEVADVANAIFDGADAIMLSGETAKGKYPIKSLQTMAKIAKTAESKLSELHHEKITITRDSVSEFIASSAYYATKNLDVKAIIAPTSSGFTAKNISRFRPNVPILAFCENHDLCRQLSLSWGVVPHNIAVSKNISELVGRCCQIIYDEKMLKGDDLVIFMAGLPIGKSGGTSMIDINTLDNLYQTKANK